MKTCLLGLAVLAACVAPVTARQAVRMAVSDKARTVVVHAGSYELRSILRY